MILKLIEMKEKIFYHELTWPEVKEAVKNGKIPLLPVGSIEQHGPHLPIVTDTYLVFSICVEAAKKTPKEALVMPPICYGCSGHHMDFPGTISICGEYFIGYVLDVCKSLISHGFMKIIIVNGHGGNTPFLDVVTRKISDETRAVCAMVPWWRLALDEIEKVRESEFPGGMAHSGELETSMWLHLKPEAVYLERAVKEIGFQKSDFIWLDLLRGSPVYYIDKWSRISKTGILGDPTVATAEKGREVAEAAVNNLVRFINEFKKRQVPPSIDHH